jgi:hypothetical protein
MATLKQIEANRRNARLSTGPRTPEGKAAIRYNACKHGLTSREVVLPGESQEEFQALRNAYRSEFQPRSPQEEDLVLQMASADWRLRRSIRVEAALSLLRFGEMFERFHRHETRIRRGFDKALQALQLVQARPAPQRGN